MLKRCNLLNRFLISTPNKVPIGLECYVLPCALRGRHFHLTLWESCQRLETDITLFKLSLWTMALY